MAKDKLLPKIALDHAMLRKLNDFYKSSLSDRYLNNPCFSHPNLKLHFCNPKALLEGGAICEHCRHIPNRRCKIACNVNHFCLIVFAYRLGIGGADLVSAIRDNAQLKWEDLMNQVSVAIRPEPKKEVVVEIPVKVPIVPKIDVGVLQHMEIPNQLKDLSQDLISLVEASKIYECTPSNIYNFVKGGKLAATASPDGKFFVSVADVKRLKKERDLLNKT